MESENLKILVLIITADTLPVYVELQKIWKRYMHLDKEHFHAYFLKGDSDLSKVCEVKDDVIWTKSPENLKPGLLNKTILAMEHMQQRIGDFDFDYVLRTNLSSFYVFPRLLKFIETLPKHRCYCGCHIMQHGYSFCSGAGTILSRDLVESMVRNKEQFLNHQIIDDWVIGSFMANQEKVSIINASRMVFKTREDWEKNKDDIPDYIFHFRCKQANPELRLENETYIQSELLKKFYGKA